MSYNRDVILADKPDQDNMYAYQMRCGHMKVNGKTKAKTKKEAIEKTKKLYNKWTSRVTAASGRNFLRAYAEANKAVAANIKA